MIGSTIQTAFNAPARKIGARVELWEGETLAQSFFHTDAIKSIKVERVGEESKFFGFGICQKLNVHFVDVAREIAITTANNIRVAYALEGEEIAPFPPFFVTEGNRDENTNELSITAYDALYSASGRTVAELNLTSYTIEEFAAACATALGVGCAFFGVEAATLATTYAEGANFEGSETLRDALNAVAEATQTIYFVNCDNVLVFKRLAADVVATIGKDQYFTLKSGDNRRLATIAHVTELGDNVSASTIETGSTQYVRNNPFWDMREDIADLVNNALAAVGGFTINQFECEWRGNPCIEIGDCIELVTKDNDTAISYVLNDVIEYAGYLKGSTQWKFTESESESSNPTSLGEALKKTFAKVDKANARIELVASDVKTATDALTGTVEELTERVQATVTQEELRVEIAKETAKGAEKVETATGFVFNDDGLLISKSNSEMATQITEDGMTVSKNGEDVLTANNSGVNAKNLHANTYLIIGNNSRFEDYGSDRTGCFWIGG